MEISVEKYGKHVDLYLPYGNGLKLREFLTWVKSQNVGIR